MRAAYYFLDLFSIPHMDFAPTHASVIAIILQWLAQVILLDACVL